MDKCQAETTFLENETRVETAQTLRYNNNVGLMELLSLKHDNDKNNVEAKKVNNYFINS